MAAPDLPYRRPISVGGFAVGDVDGDVVDGVVVAGADGEADGLAGAMFATTDGVADVVCAGDATSVDLHPVTATIAAAMMQVAAAIREG